MALRREQSAPLEKEKKLKEEQDRLAAEQKKLDEKFNSALEVSEADKTHSEESSDGNKAG